MSSGFEAASAAADPTDTSGTSGINSADLGVSKVEDSIGAQTKASPGYFRGADELAGAAGVPPPTARREAAEALASYQLMLAELQRGEGVVTELRAALLAQKTANEILGDRVAQLQNELSGKNAEGYLATVRAETTETALAEARGKLANMLAAAREAATQLRGNIAAIEGFAVPPADDNPLTDLALISGAAVSRAETAAQRETELVAQIAMLSDSLAKSGKRISMLEQRRAEGGYHVGNLEAEMRKLAEREAAAVAELSEKRALVIELEKACADGGMHVRGLERQLSENSFALARLERSLRDRDEQIQNLRTQHAEYATAADLTRSSELDAEVRGLRRQITDGQRKIADMAQEIEELRGHLDAGGAHVRGLEAELARFKTGK